jgi:MFS family permease
MCQPGEASEVPVGQAEPPTRVRYEVMALVAVMSVLLYLDRFCIGMAVPRITAELHLSKLEMSAVLSAFFLSYALAQVPTGWLGERLGARTMLAGCVLVWSLLTGLTGVLSGLAGLIVARLLMGISQAGAYPIAARINSLWVPYGQRALANGLVTMGGRAGFAIAPILTAELILWYNDDWRPAFWLYGLLGIGWVVSFVVKFRNQPSEHPGCNAAEVDLIVNSLPAASSNPHGKGVRLPWGVALRSLGLWLQCLTQITSNIAWVFFGTWMPTYLIEEYQVGLGTAGALSSLPPLAGAIGCLLGGMASDRLVHTLGIRWGRSALGMGSKLSAALFMLLSVLADDPYLATTMLVIAAFVNDLGLGATWAYFQDTGGPYVGPLLGFANMFGNLGATASAPIVARVQTLFGWHPAIAVCAGLFAVSGVTWFGIDSGKPIVPKEGACVSG